MPHIKYYLQLYSLPMSKVTVDPPITFC